MQKKWYYYRVYGLNIKSDIEIKEFVEINNHDSIQVTICYSEIPDRIINKFREGNVCDINDNDIWFNIENIAVYHVKDGNLINYNPYENVDFYYLKTFIECTCLGFIMLQRNKIAIHGGTSVINDQAIIITGEKGAGKSSLTTALREKGYKFISDDIAPIEFGDSIEVNPGFPYQKLCYDTAKKMEYNPDEFFSFMSDSEIKYLIPVFNDFQSKDTELASIFEIVKGNVDTVIIEEVKSSDKLANIIKNIYRGEFIGILGGMKPEYFKKCLNIAQKVKMYKIIRPYKGFTVDDQIRLIEEKVFTRGKNEIIYKC